MLWFATVNACFSLKTTKNCPEFDLSASPINENGVLLFSDQVSFDEFMEKKLSDEGVLTEFNCDTTKSTFKNASNSLPERRLYYCAYYAAASVQCDNDNKNKNILCQSTCQDYANNVQNNVFPGDGCVETKIGIRQSSLDIVRNSCSKASFPQYRYLGGTGSCVALVKDKSSSTSVPGSGEDDLGTTFIPIGVWIALGLGIPIILILCLFAAKKLRKKTSPDICKDEIAFPAIDQTHIVEPEPKISLEGKNVLVVHPYNATLDDELTLNVGDMIAITKEYQDGWALGYNHSSKMEGVFPAACVGSPHH
eukprot:NODE_381_length_8377_cov_0.385238.p4 type:complete len:308 gc:universal NODE_381_length_8377_cov_0.385238:5586-6509(+)